MLQRPLVLIVDDDDDLRMLLASLVSLLDIDTETAENGVTALEAVARRRPDVILLDMKMPVMDGWQFVEALSQRQPDPPPVVVITAAPDPAERAAEVGAQAWLGKPFDTDEVLAKVRRFLPFSGEVSHDR